MGERRTVWSTSCAREAAVITTWRQDNTYGFARRTTGEDVFVHHSALAPNVRWPLDVGAKITFVLERHSKGLRGRDVRLERLGS
jgi:cold shock CspA family protein